MDRISFSALHKPGALGDSEMGNSGRDHRQLRNFLSLLHEQLRVGEYLITAATFGSVESDVSTFDQFLAACSVATVHSYSDADCELLVAIESLNFKVRILY